MQSKKILSWALRIIAAVILLQTLYFKFSASEESVYIFSTIGIEPWGRIGTGIAELIASVLILLPRTVSIGALMAAGIMAGALISHLTILGIVVKDDGGYLFSLCLIVMACSIVLLFMYRHQLREIIKQLTASRTKAIG
ncbi:DoxX family protein [soil metagenome]